MNTAEIEQGSDEWLRARLGKVTASKINDVMAKGQSGKPSATRASYLGKLVAERMSGEVHDGFRSPTMERGNEVEQSARDAYAFMEDATLEKVGFIPHPEIEMTGASPDALVGALGLAEFKCPDTHTHIATLQGKTIPRVYRLQMQFQMAVTGREWCDYVSFDPRMPASMQLHVQRVKRDQAEIDEIEAAIIEFLEEVKSTVADLEKRFNQKEAA